VTDQLGFLRCREWDLPKHEFFDQCSKEELKNYTGQVTLQSYKPTVLTDVTPLLRGLGQTPVQFILAKDDPVPGQRQAFEAVQSPKSLVEVEGHHFSVYTTARAEAAGAATDWLVKQFYDST
jgi:hypothetical protein